MGKRAWEQIRIETKISVRKKNVLPVSFWNCVDIIPGLILLRWLSPSLSLCFTVFQPLQIATKNASSLWHAVCWYAMMKIMNRYTPIQATRKHSSFIAVERVRVNGTSTNRRLRVNRLWLWGSVCTREGERTSAAVPTDQHWDEKKKQCTFTHTSKRWSTGAASNRFWRFLIASD